MQMKFFMNGPMVKFFLIIILFYIERKWLLKSNLPVILLLKYKLFSKLCFNVIDGSIEMIEIIKFLKILIKIKSFKTFYEVQTASRLKQITQHPPPRHHPSTRLKASYDSEKKIFLWRHTTIYRHLFSKCFKNTVLGLLEMMHCKCFL